MQEEESPKMQSPRTMVESVFAQAMKEQAAAQKKEKEEEEAALKKIDDKKTSDYDDAGKKDGPPNDDRSTSITTTTMTEDQQTTNTTDASSSLPSSKSTKYGSSKSITTSSDDYREQLDAIWDDVHHDDDWQQAMVQTMALVGQETQAVVQAGADAFRQLHVVTSANAQLKRSLEGKTAELERLRAAEEKNRASVANLLRAVEASKAESRDAARAAVQEASLRAELSVANTKKNEAVGQAHEYKHKATLLEQELRQVKIKLVRVTQDKAKLERDQRAALSLAKSMNQYHQQGASGSTAADVEYYKKKLAEATERNTSMNGLLAEKNRQIDQLRAQIERSMSQNCLEIARAGKTAGRKRSR